jgi:hypothetical protein
MNNRKMTIDPMAYSKNTIYIVTIFIMTITQMTISQLTIYPNDNLANIDLPDRLKRSSFEKSE